MASTGAILVGVYGIIRGLISVLLGLLLLGVASILSSLGAGGLGGLATIIGAITLLSGVVLFVVAVGLFIEKSWAPVLGFIAFGLLAVLGIVQIVQTGDIGVLTIAFLLLDGVSAGWAAMNAPEIPIGDSQKGAQAV